MIKKRIVLAFVLLVFGFNFAGAVSSNLNESYERGETIIAEISGNLLENIGRNQVDFRRGHISVPFEFDIMNLGGRHFIWAIASDNENNYTLVIKDIVTVVSGYVEEVEYQKNFSVGGNLTDYYVKPGFVFAKDDFEIRIVSNLDNDKTIKVDFPVEKEIVVRPGENRLSFSAESFSKGLTKINVGKYEIPIYSANLNETIEEEATLEITPRSITDMSLTDAGKEYPIKLNNYGKKKIENVSVRYNENVVEIDLDENRSLESFDLEAGEELVFNLKIKDEYDLKDGEILEETIYFDVEEKTFELPINIAFTRNESGSGNESGSVYYCRELEGEVCLGGETCDGESEESIEGACCIGKCVDQGNEGNAWIGWTLAGIILLIIIFVYSRYKTRKEKDNFRKRISKAEKKIKG